MRRAASLALSATVLVAASVSSSGQSTKASGTLKDATKDVSTEDTTRTSREEFESSARGVIAEISRQSFRSTVEAVKADSALTRGIAHDLVESDLLRGSPSDSDVEQFLSSSQTPKEVSAAYDQLIQAFAFSAWHGREEGKYGDENVLDCLAIIPNDPSMSKVGTVASGKVWLQGEPGDNLRNYDKSRCDICQLLKSPLFDAEDRANLLKYYQRIMFGEMGVLFNSTNQGGK